jgi:hypothetical protein
MRESAHQSSVRTFRNHDKWPKKRRLLSARAGISVAVTAAGGVNPMATDGDGQMKRRTFCNGALLTSAVVVLLANEAKSQKQGPRETLVAIRRKKSKAQQS